MLVGAGRPERHSGLLQSYISVTQARDEEEGACGSDDTSDVAHDAARAAARDSRANGVPSCCGGDDIHRIATGDDLHLLSWQNSYRVNVATCTALCVATTLSNVIDAAVVLPTSPFTGAALVFGLAVGCAVSIEVALVRSYVSREPLGPSRAAQASLLCTILTLLLGTARGVLPIACQGRTSPSEVPVICHDIQFNLLDSDSALNGVALALLVSHGLCLPARVAIGAIITFSFPLIVLRLSLSSISVHLSGIASTVIFFIVAGVCVRLGFDRDFNARRLQRHRDATLCKQLTRESEAAQQAAATAYSATIGFMMHDLRTPLQGIASSLYFLQSSKDIACVPRSSTLHRDLKQIGLCVGRITTLCNDVLDLSTVGGTGPSAAPGSSTRAPINPTFSSPRDIVRDVINQVSRATPVPIVTRIAGTIPVKALADGSRLRRTILAALASAVRVARSRTTVVVLVYSVPPEKGAADADNSVASAADGERLAALSREQLPVHRTEKGTTPDASPDGPGSSDTACGSGSDPERQRKSFPSPPRFAVGRRKRERGRRASAYAGGHAQLHSTESWRVAKGGAAPVLPEWAVQWQASNPAQGRLWSQPRQMAVQITFLESSGAASASRYHSTSQSNARASRPVSDESHASLVRTEGELKIPSGVSARQLTRRGSDPPVPSWGDAHAQCPAAPSRPPHAASGSALHAHGARVSSHSQLARDSVGYTLEEKGPGYRLQATPLGRDGDLDTDLDTSDHGSGVRGNGHAVDDDRAKESGVHCGDERDSGKGAAQAQAGESQQLGSLSRRWSGEELADGEEGGCGGHQPSAHSARVEGGADTCRALPSPLQSSWRRANHSSTTGSGDNVRRRRQWSREVLAAMTSDVSLRLVYTIAASMSGSLSVHHQSELLKQAGYQGRPVPLGTASRRESPPRGGPATTRGEAAPSTHGAESPGSHQTQAESLTSSTADPGSDRGVDSASSLGHSRHQAPAHRPSDRIGTNHSGKGLFRGHRGSWRGHMHPMGRRRRPPSKGRDSFSASHMTLESPIDSQVPPNDVLVHKAAERVAASHIRLLRLPHDGSSQGTGLTAGAVETLLSKCATTMLLLVPIVQRGSQGPSGIAARANARTTSAPLAQLSQTPGLSMPGTAGRDADTEESAEDSGEDRSQEEEEEEGSERVVACMGYSASSAAGASAEGTPAAASPAVAREGQALAPLPEEQDVVILREPGPEGRSQGSASSRDRGPGLSPQHHRGELEPALETPSAARSLSACETETSMDTGACASSPTRRDRGAVGGIAIALHGAVQPSGEPGPTGSLGPATPPQRRAGVRSPREQGEAETDGTRCTLSSSNTTSTVEAMPALADAPPPHSVPGTSSLTLASHSNETGPSTGTGIESTGSTTVPPHRDLPGGTAELHLAPLPMISGPASLVLADHPFPPGAVHQALGPPNAARLRVLVTEDERSTRRLLVRMVQRLGVLDIVEAADGTELISRASDAQSSGKPFHIILSDIVMRQMNGDEALHILRQTGVSAPAIAVTGNASLADQERLRGLGFARVIVKPCSMHDLAAALRLANDPM